MRKTSIYYFTAMALFAQSVNAAEPAFEAYQKFILGGQHVGYVIQRFEVDDAKKELRSIYYVYVKTPAGTTTESLDARADMNFEPLSYKYTTVADGKIKAIDATFKNKKLTAKIIQDGKTYTGVLDVPKDGFLSTFLNYVLIKNGLSVGKNYTFYALAEEQPFCIKGDANCRAQDAGFLKGNAAIKFQQKFKDLDSYRVDIEFKGVAFVGVVSATGEALGTDSPLQNALTEIVATRAEAVGNIPFSEKNVRAVFGNIPEGKKNSLVKLKEKLVAVPIKTENKKTSKEN